MNLPVIRYPSGNFDSPRLPVDGVGPLPERPARRELASHTIETYHFADYGIQNAKERNQIGRMPHRPLGQPFLGLLQPWD